MRIKKRTAAANTNSELSDSNQPKKNRPSPLNQVVVADEMSDSSDNKSEVRSKHEDNQKDKNKDKFSDLATDQLFDMLTTDVEDKSCSKKSKKQTFKTNAAKQDNLPNEIFDYIHAAKCRRLFFLAWYDDQTYISASKTLPDPCCNGPSCSSDDLECLKKTPFIKHIPIKYTETDREWIAYRIAELKKWRTAKSKAYWLKQEVEDNMPETLLMLDACIV